MSAEGIKEREARERNERAAALQNKRNERLARTLKLSLRSKLRLERAERIREKRGEAETPGQATRRQAAFAEAATDFMAKIEQSRTRGADMGNPEVIQRAAQQLVGQHVPAKPHAGRGNTSMPLDFYCWKDGRMAVVTVLVQGEPAIL